MNYDTRIAADDLAETDSATVLMGDAEEDRRSRRKLLLIGLAVLAGLVAIWFLTHSGDTAATGDKKSQAAVVSVIAPDAARSRVRSTLPAPWRRAANCRSACLAKAARSSLCWSNRASGSGPARCWQ